MTDSNAPPQAMAAANSNSRPQRQTASAPPHPSGDAPASGSAPPPPPGSRATPSLSYMHRPPRIVPNYGKRSRGVLPKSNVSRVLLYDNVTQEQMLHVRISHLRAEQHKITRLMDLHRKSFIKRRQQKERQMAETALHVDHELLEQGLLSAKVPQITEDKPQDKPRAQANRIFNPYIDAKVENEKTNPRFEKRQMTPQLTNETTANDSPAHQRLFAEGRDSPRNLVTVDRRRAATSDCLVTSNPPPAKPTVHRAAFTAKATRETAGHGALPYIHSAQGHSQRTGKTLVDSTQRRDGLTRILHTFQDGEEGGKGRGGAKLAGGGGGEEEGGGGNTMEDERYQLLEKMLVRLEPRSEGYLELSPSFRSPRETISLSRPSSFQIHSLYRRRSASSASSALTAHVGIEVQDL